MRVCVVCRQILGAGPVASRPPLAKLVCIVVGQKVEHGLYCQPRNTRTSRDRETYTHCAHRNSTHRIQAARPCGRRPPCWRTIDRHVPVTVLPIAHRSRADGGAAGSPCRTEIEDAQGRHQPMRIMCSSRMTVQTWTNQCEGEIDLPRHRRTLHRSPRSCLFLRGEHCRENTRQWGSAFCTIPFTNEGSSTLCMRRVGASMFSTVNRPFATESELYLHSAITN